MLIFPHEYRIAFFQDTCNFTVSENICNVISSDIWHKIFISYTNKDKCMFMCACLSVGDQLKRLLNLEIPNLAQAYFGFGCWRDLPQ